MFQDARLNPKPIYSAPRGRLGSICPSEQLVAARSWPEFEISYSSQACQVGLRR